MCNFKRCIYSITDTIDEGDMRHELFLFCSFHDCLPKDCPAGCTSNPDVPADIKNLKCVEGDDIPF